MQTTRWGGHNSSIHARRSCEVFLAGTGSRVEDLQRGAAARQGRGGRWPATQPCENWLAELERHRGRTKTVVSPGGGGLESRHLLRTILNVVDRHKWPQPRNIGGERGGGGLREVWR